MKNLKKSEIVVYVVALMLVTAGYFNYTANGSKNLVETYSEDVQKLEDTANANVGDAVLVSNNEADNTSGNDVAIVDNDDMQEESSSQVDNQVDNQVNNQVSNQVDNNTVSDNSLVSNDNENSVKTNADATNYFASSKLERETMYANMLSSYQSILDNNNVSETQKSIASKEITKINNTKNSIMICENLIMTKGFDNCVILINENSVNVVVRVKDGLNTEKVAQIQNIISREIGTQIENIHIMEN